MSLYVDTSALLKRYLDEEDSDHFADYLESDPRWISSRLTEIETRRNLARALSGRVLSGFQSTFARDWDRFEVIEIDGSLCSRAAEIAELTGARSLDAIHLAAAQRVGGGMLSFLTANLRQAQVARSLGLNVAGV